MKQERPYNHKNTDTRLLIEVKCDLVEVVLRWGTTLECSMLFFSSFVFRFLLLHLCFLQNTSTYAKLMHFACACGEAKDPKSYSKLKSTILRDFFGSLILNLCIIAVFILLQSFDLASVSFTCNFRIILKNVTSIIIPTLHLLS